MLIVDTEIKLIVMSLIARATPTLLEGKFEVADPLNTVRSLLPIFLLANLHARTSSRARHTGDPATKGHPCFRAPLEAVSPGLATASRHSHGPPEPLRSTAKPRPIDCQQLELPPSTAPRATTRSVQSLTTPSIRTSRRLLVAHLLKIFLPSGPVQLFLYTIFRPSARTA